jgi:hypothetical protein
VSLSYDAVPEHAEVELLLGGASPRFDRSGVVELVDSNLSTNVPAALAERAVALRKLHERLSEAGLGDSYEDAHVLLALQAMQVTEARRTSLDQKKIDSLPEPSGAAADRLYDQTATRLADGLESVIKTYASTNDPHKRRVFELSQPILKIGGANSPGATRDLLHQ